MLAQGGGAIVNTASGAGVIADPGMAPYVAAKHGVVGLTRAAAPWARRDGVRYPGTYLAGGYNRLHTDIAGRVVENEDLVNFPNWLSLELRFGDGEWFDERRVRLVSHRQELDLRCGVLERQIVFEDGQGRRSRLEERRLVSMADMHCGTLELRIVAENGSGRVTLRSEIDGRIVNAGARLHACFNNRHLEPLFGDSPCPDGVRLLVRTSQSNLHVAMAARTRVLRGGAPVDAQRRPLAEPGYIAQETDVWRRFDVHLRAAREFTLNVPMLLRLNMFHLLQAASLNSIGLDIGIPARGWTGEAYQGVMFP